jgi:phage recombination protein Bet
MDSGSQRSGWTAERVDLVKQTVCPKGISTDEFLLFIEQCKRSGLDPLLKEAFCVARRQNIGNRDKPNWVTKHEFQPSEAGMLARAERFPDFRGLQASAVFAEDEILVNQGKGEVNHSFNPAKRKGALVGAWARLVRENRLPIVVWLDFSGYVQQTPLWSKIPTTMIEKCARVAALRKAYPEAFGGLYVREEMPEEEADEDYAGPVQQPSARAAMPARTATREAAEMTQRDFATAGREPAEMAEVVRDREVRGQHTLKREPAQSEGERRAQPVQSAKDAWTPDAASGGTTTALVANGGDVIGYGKWSGVRLSEATIEQVRECVDAMKVELASDKPVHNAPQLRATQTVLAKWLVDKVATPRPEPEVAFGKLKGRKLASLTDPELSGVHDHGSEKAQAPGAAKQPWFSALAKCMADVEEEVSRRERAKQSQQTTREPGIEG